MTAFSVAAAFSVEMQSVGLFCVSIGLFCVSIGLFSVSIGLFCVSIGSLWKCSPLTPLHFQWSHILYDMKASFRVYILMQDTLKLAFICHIEYDSTESALESVSWI